MGIIFDEKTLRFSLETKNTTYQMQVDEIGVLIHLYYGANIAASDMGYLIEDIDRGFSGNPFEIKERRGYSLDTRPLEYSGFGAGDFRVNAVGIVGADGSRTVDLRYVSHTISNGKRTLNGLPYVRENASSVSSLSIILEDRVALVRVTLFYSVFEDKDIITRSAIIENIGESCIDLTKAASMSMDFSFGEFDMIHFYGRHCMERNVEREPVANDIQVVSSIRGMSSHHHNPFVILCDRDTTEDYGDCFGFMLMYSGNHSTEIEKSQSGSVRVVSGINPTNFCWKLSSGECFETPEVILSYSGAGLSELSNNYHRIIRENVCNPRYLTERRPVLINNWEATYFDFDKEKILDIAKEAASLGIDMLVLDDGWFGNRYDDNRALGDWFVNESKVGGSLSNLVKEVNDIGLSFGLWFEPEMINEDSDLYRAHPNWAVKDPGRMPVMSRNQMVLDMSREEVVDYLFDKIDFILSNANIKYIKWDFNRAVSNCYSTSLGKDRQGEFAHRFMLGTYSLMQRLTDAHPDLMIEGCAGGGGRFDAGILFYSPQIWCSDNTDPINRLKIQEGTSYGYPISSMGAHVSASPNHQTLRETGLNTRAVVAMAGTFGYELDPGKLSASEKEEIKKQIKDFKNYYWLIQKGKYYRLTGEKNESFFTSWEIVSEDATEILLSVVVTDVKANPLFPFVKLKGLKPDGIYVDEASGREYTGIALMKGGYSFGVMQGVYPAKQIHFVLK